MLKRMKQLFYLSFLVLIFQGSSYLSFPKSLYDELRPEFERINRDDGIDEEEATLISRYYIVFFREYFTKVLSYSRPVEEDVRWRIDVDGKFGFFPIKTYIRHIYIDKISGDTYSSSSPGLGSGNFAYKNVKYRVGNNLRSDYRVENPYDIRTSVYCGFTKDVSEKFCHGIAIEIAENLLERHSNLIKLINISNITVKESYIHDCLGFVTPDPDGECNIWVADIPMEYKAGRVD